MASNIVVSDRDSLVANFAENSKQVLCSAAFGAGAYAIGGRLLGLPPLTPASALVTGGALLAGLTLCPANANQGDIFGTPPDFSGGQCPVLYDFTYSKSDDLISPAQGRINANIQGPIRGVDFTTGNNGAGSAQWYSLRIFEGPNTLYYFPQFAFTQQGGSCTYQFVRDDNLPDNCGNAPSSGGQIITNNVTGDTIDNSTVVNNQDYSVVVPVQIDVGGISNTLNLNFGPIVIGSLLPLTFDIDIGGSNFRFREKPGGELEPVETNPDDELSDNKIEQILKDIKGCVCKPEVDLDLLYLPLVDNSVSCDIRSASFLVPRGSVSDSLVDAFVSSAVLANRKCEEVTPEQLPEKLLFSATTSSGGGEVFTEEIGNEVISLRVKITEYNENLLPQITSYPDSNQRKFGSVSYVGPGVEGGGDYLYVFDTDTYIPLPRRGKKGRLRILFKPGTSFQVFDTGERI
jgi:hypothetical protein